MAKTVYTKEGKKIGEQIRKLRKAKGLTIEDLSVMTGISRSRLTEIEKGAGTNTNYLVEIARALGEQPKTLFDITIELKPRHKLLAKPRITHTIRLLLESDYFIEPRLVENVKQVLMENHKIKVTSAQVSVVLLRFVNDGKLKAAKKGRRNLYARKN